METKTRERIVGVINELERGAISRTLAASDLRRILADDNRKPTFELNSDCERCEREARSGFRHPFMRHTCGQKGER